jgi:hypothetical protein
MQTRCFESWVEAVTKGRLLRQTELEVRTEQLGIDGHPLKRFEKAKAPTNEVAP